MRTPDPTANFGCATSRRGLSPQPQVSDHLVVDRRFTGILWRRGEFGDPVGEFLLGHVALVDEELGDAAQPLLVVAELEVVEGVHRLGAGAQVGPRPLVLEGGRHLVDGIGRQRRAEVVRQPHHRDVDAEDPFLPLLDEDALLQSQRFG